MALTATAESIAAVGSHSVNAAHASGAKIDKEECFPVLPMYWRGKTYRAQFSADRYVHSSGWSDWRVHLYDVRADDGTNYGAVASLTDAMRAAMNKAGAPIIREWLNGTTVTDEGKTYATSRARAFRWFVSRKMTSENPTEYNVRYAGEALEMHADELTADDRETLRDALAHLVRFVETIAQLD